MTPGAAAKLTVWRKGEEKSFSLTLGEVPQAREARAASPDSDAAGASLPKLGLSLAPAGEIAGSGSEGVVVTEIDQVSDLKQKLTVILATRQPDSVSERSSSKASQTA